MSSLPAPIGPLPLPEIIARYRAGESIQRIAAECAVHRDTIYRWLLGGLGDQHYHELVTDCLVKRVSDADKLLEDESYDIARAREIARFARMDLERRRPALYGAKQADLGMQITVNVTREKSMSCDVSEVRHEVLPLLGSSPSSTDSSEETTPSAT